MQTASITTEDKILVVTRNDSKSLWFAPSSSRQYYLPAGALADELVVHLEANGRSTFGIGAKYIHANFKIKRTQSK